MDCPLEEGEVIVLSDTSQCEGPAPEHLLSILVPAFNEGQTIGLLLHRVLSVETEHLGFGKEVIVVDDASSDTTAAMSGDLRPRPPGAAVQHGERGGKAAAVRTALAAATGDYCIIQDADLEYSPEDYCALLVAVRRGANVVFGSRFLACHWPRGMRTSHWLANRVLSATTNVFYHSGLTDEATCLKLFPTALLRELELHRQMFDFCPEVTAKLGKRGVRIAEVPIRYCARSKATPARRCGGPTRCGPARAARGTAVALGGYTRAWIVPPDAYDASGGGPVRIPGSALRASLRRGGALGQ